VGRASLEHSLAFKRPGFLCQFPFGMGPYKCRDGEEIRLEVGPEIKACSLPCALRKRVHKKRTDEAVLVMTAFRPRIWKQNEDRRKFETPWQRSQKFARVGDQKIEVL